MRRILLAIAAAALFLAACGGSGTPLPAPGTSGKTLSAQQVLDQLKAQGVPIGASVVYTAETDVNHQLGRPNGYVAKANFNDTRLKPADDFSTDAGGSVEIFSNSDGATARKKYIDDIGKALPMLSEYSYINGGILLRVSSTLTPAQAAEYEAALKKVH
jgi:hypothetical protein